MEEDGDGDRIMHRMEMTGMRMMMMRKMQTLFSLLFAFRVRWVEDVCVCGTWEVGRG